MSCGGTPRADRLPTLRRSRGGGHDAEPRSAWSFRRARDESALARLDEEDRILDPSAMPASHHRSDALDAVDAINSGRIQQLSRGYVIPIGGAEDEVRNLTILRKVAKLCGGKHARIAIQPTVSQERDTGRRYEDVFEEIGAREAITLSLSPGPAESRSWIPPSSSTIRWILRRSTCQCP
jgi:hypothetical protein